MFGGSTANQAPTLVVSQIGERDHATGAVTYQATVTDGDARGLTLSFTRPRDGVVADLGHGIFRYTPIPRVNAHSDTFTVNASDGRGGSLDSTVTWVNDDQVPRNITVSPVVDSAIGEPDPTTGMVTGACCVTGADNTYTVSAPGTGTVVIDATTGAWAYRPTGTARHQAVADGATTADRHDSFTVTVADAHGGTAVVPVTVSLVSMKTVPSYAVTAEISTGGVPVGLAVSQHGDRVYVTSFVDEAAVTVVGTIDNTRSTIPLNFRPEGVAVSFDGLDIYVADPAGGRVAVIDPADHSVFFVPVGNHPFHLAVSGTDLFVANNSDGTVSVIDTIENVLVRTIAVGGRPYAVAASGGRLYVTDYGYYGGESSHTMAVIDSASGELLHRIPVGYYPTGVVVSPDGKRVYVTNDEGSYTDTHPGTTTVIDAETGEVVDTWAVGGISIALGPNGNQVYIVSHGYQERFTSKLSIVDTATGRVTGVPINGLPNASVANGNELYISDTWHSSVVQITAGSACAVDTDAANDAPLLTVAEVGPHTFAASFVDPDNDIVTCTATQPFSGTVSDLGAGRFQYTPNNRAAEGFIDHFAITADDGHGGVVTKTVAATR
jgi:YVTN family beta-propeller protein/VCBS repeat-containing protein